MRVHHYLAASAVAFLSTDPTLVTEASHGGLVATFARHSCAVSGERLLGDTYEDLSEAYDSAMSAWRRVPRTERGESPDKSYFPQFRALADGGDAKAMLWVVRKLRHVELEGLDRSEVAGAYIPKLIEGHASAEWLGPLATTMMIDQGSLPAPRRVELMRSWIEAGPHDSNECVARYCFGQVLLETGTPEDRAEALEVLAAVAEEFPEELWAERARGDVFRESRLQVGMTVPDFESEDADGVTFKLSDYRGEVVLLKFWAFW